MADKTDAIHTESIELQRAAAHHQDATLEKAAPMEHIAEYAEAQHINLTWKSWMVVFVTCFAIMAQV